MLQGVRMPALGQTTDELRIISWLKKEGDPVEQGEPLFAVETDKATLEVEAFSSGILRKIVYQEDEVVDENHGRHRSSCRGRCCRRALFTHT